MPPLSFSISLLRYYSHIIKLILLKCTVYCKVHSSGIVYSQSCTTSTTLEHCHHSSKKLHTHWQSFPTSHLLLQAPGNDKYTFCLYQFSSVAQPCPTLCDPLDCSTLGLPVHHQLLEFTQTHVHWVSDAIQPSYLLSSPSPPAFNLSQHQGLFQWVGSSSQF